MVIRKPICCECKYFEGTIYRTSLRNKFHRILEKGDCRRYPPVFVKTKLLGLKHDIKHPEVAFDRDACGEFTEKHEQSTTEVA